MQRLWCVWGKLCFKNAFQYAFPCQLYVDIEFIELYTLLLFCNKEIAVERIEVILLDDFEEDEEKVL